MADPGSAALLQAETRRRLGHDRARLRRFQVSKFGYAPLTWFFDPAWICVKLYRLSHRHWQAGQRKRARFYIQLNSLVTGADLMPHADIGGGLLIPSPCGVNISCKAGRNLTALALAGIGGSVRDRDIGAGLGLPLLGDDVTASQFVGIQGSIQLGDGAVVDYAAGAVVDVAAGARMTVAAEPVIASPPPVPEDWPAPMPECRHGAWRQTRAAFDADVDRYIAELAPFLEPGQAPPKRLSVMLSNSLLALYVHRLSHWLFLNGHRRTAHLLALVNVLLHKVTITPGSCLGGGVLTPHLAGVLFVGQAGSNLTLYASSLCAPFGWQHSHCPASGPRLGDQVLVGGQCAAAGAIRIGDRVQLGPKGQVQQDVADDSQVWSLTARGTVNPKPASPQDLPITEPAPLAPPTWRETRMRMARDRRRLHILRQQAAEPVSRLLLLPAFLCVRLHRLSHYFHGAGHRRLARWCWLVNVYLTGADISPQSQIGGGLLIPYPAGIALHCRAGTDLTVLASSGIGAGLGPDGGQSPLAQAPHLGDGVELSHHSGIYGAIIVGSGVKVQPGCTVIRPVPDGVTLVARPVKIRRSSVRRTS